MLLRPARSHALLSQAELGERAGVARSVIADYECGRNSPTVRQLDRLLAAAGLLVVVQLKPLSAILTPPSGAALPGQSRTASSSRRSISAHCCASSQASRVASKGAAAALLQGAPVPVPAVDVAIADTEPY